VDRPGPGGYRGHVSEAELVVGTAASSFTGLQRSLSLLGPDYPDTLGRLALR
jgi:hypothetical protein